MLLDTDEVYERYLRFRAVGKKLHTELVPLLRRKEIFRCAKELGLLRKKTLIFADENDLSVLMDYCIHNPSGGKSCIDIHIERSSPEPDSDEMMSLLALRESFFSILRLTGIEKGFLCHATDFLRSRNIVLIDVGFGATGQPGVMLSTQLKRLPGTEYYMTTGAPMLISESHAIDELNTILMTFREPISNGSLSRAQSAYICKRATRSLLRQDNSGLMLADPDMNEGALQGSAI
ncbi:MAG: hypothetical protein U9R74_08245 [Pseudomonadota bacterium]|nr:hypothetical protein [Pseudomonadota bacterium]